MEDNKLEFERVLKALFASNRVESEYRDNAEYLKKIETDYEWKVYSAPLIGCGAGLLLFSSALGYDKIADSFVPFIVPSIWCFFAGVVAVVVAGFWYTRHLRHTIEMNTLKGNAQQIFLDIYDGMRNAVKEKKTVRLNFPKYEKERVLEIVSLKAKARLRSKKADRTLLLARISIGFSFVLFCVGVLIPLVELSSNLKFAF